MNMRKDTYSLEFQLFVKRVETALIQAAADARELAERMKIPLITQKREIKEPNIDGKTHE